MAAEVQREVECKFDVAPDFAMPDLHAFVPDGGVVSLDVVALSSTYHDTADNDLLRFRLTLRRREGDTDTGWQLKVPAGVYRTELRWPLGEADQMPQELRDLLRPFVRHRPVVPAVRLDVTRTRYHLLDADGELLVEVAYDDVRAVGLGSEVRAPRWHEVEVELKDGTPALQSAISRALVDAGAVASSSRSKLARALLGIGNEGVGTPRTSAGAVLIDYIAQQCDGLVAGHFAIRRNAPDSVHATRVACRRLRSTLRTFDQCFDADQAVLLEDELKWFAGVLGGVRDLEVLRARIAAAIADLPDELVVGPVAEHVERELATEQAARQADLVEAMAGDRYADLLAEAVRWRDDPPFTAAAGRPASTLNDAVDRIERKLSKRLSNATEPGSTDDDMHRARKTGKRVRYAAEAATGDPKTKLAKEITVLQNLLGEFQDSVVAAELLRRLASDAADHGEDGFTYGVLVAEERQRAEKARRRARRQG